MARSFASGLIWGFVVVGAGLALISQLAPLPKGAIPGAQVQGTEDQKTGTAAEADTGAVAEAPVAKATQPATIAEPAKAPAAEATAQANTAPDATTGAKDTTLSADAASADQTALKPAAMGSTTGAAPLDEAAAVPGKADTKVVESQTGADIGIVAPAAQGQADAAKTGTADNTTDQTASATAKTATSDASKTASATNDAEKPVSEAAQAKTEAAKAEPEPAQLPPEVPDAAGDLAPVAALAPPPEVPAVNEAAPALSSLDAALTAPVPDKTPAPQVPAPDPLGAKDALLVPSQGAGLAEPTRLPQIAAAEDPGLAPTPLPVVTAPGPGDVAPDAPQALAPRVLTPDSGNLPAVKPLDSTLPTVLKPSVPGVETNGLPQIGAERQADAVPGDADKPIVKYARRFENGNGKPLFVILLHDVGAAGMSRDDLAKLPFPVTFVVDPLATDAKLAEQAFRAAGQEVLMLANGIPQGATAGDIAQSFQTLQEILPETVGVIDQATAGFQDNRALSGLVLPVIADQGRGLVTYDRGLNAADQIARRDGLPAAVIFRRLDGEGESQPVMRRYLDRAAFKAAQEGSVVVIGDTRADTVATILQWTIEGKASGVELAPVTAVMGRK